VCIIFRLQRQNNCCGLQYYVAEKAPKSLFLRFLALIEPNKYDPSTQICLEMNCSTNLNLRDGNKLTFSSLASHNNERTTGQCDSSISLVSTEPDANSLASAAVKLCSFYPCTVVRNSPRHCGAVWFDCAPPCLIPN